jgi:hypothetical protein
MRVELRDDGTLVIKAETGLESFALKRWAQEYRPMNDGASAGEADAGAYQGTYLVIDSSPVDSRPSEQQPCQ